MSSTLYGNRYGIAVGVILIAFALVVGVVVWFVYGYISETLASILISGVGALGTVSLVVLTFVTLQENSRLVEEQIKQGQKPLQREVVQTLDSAIQAVESNNRRLIGEKIEWFDLDDPPKPWENEFILDTCLRDANPAVVQELTDSYPNLTERMEEYDVSVIMLYGRAEELAVRIDEPLAEIRQNTQDIAQHHHQELRMLILNRCNSEDEPEWWESNEDEVRDAITERVPELEAWYERQRLVSDESGELVEELQEAKKEIQSEYGIGLNNQE